MRRVVVTGMGIVSPLGVVLDSVWSRLVGGESGIRHVDSFDVSDIASQVAGVIPKAGSVPAGYSPEECFDASRYVDARDMRKMADFILYAMAAASDALKDSGWVPETEEDKCRTGISIGSGIGGLDRISQTSAEMVERGPRRVSPFFIPSSLINLASGNISIRYGLKGPNHAVVTACATGTHAIGDSTNMIRYGYADVMLAGATEAAVCRIGLAGFAAARALSTSYNDSPTEASRPWDNGRDGFVMSEGAGVLVLEEYEHAVKRGAKIYAEVLGYGMSGDAYHITSPSPDGDGATRSMKSALENAGVSTEEIDYINAHGTSTPAGDILELKAVTDLFSYNKNLCMSSTKSSIGHALGAAGAIEAIFCVKAIQTSIVPPTLNLHNPCAESHVDLVPLKSKERRLGKVMSNSFGFGGTNATLLFGRVD